tara:strand:+ start:97 stop:873 length:777 start_codon:yes stop_codon:yes gene_type:complete
MEIKFISSLKNTTWKEKIFILFLIYLLVDVMMFGYNYQNFLGPGGCKKTIEDDDENESWISGFPFLLSNIHEPEVDCTEYSQGTALENRFREYRDKNSPNFVNNQGMVDFEKDLKKKYNIEGFTTVKLIAYVIVPVVTIETIGIWLISTRANKAEWTFWIIIITLICTGLITLLSEKETLNISEIPTSDSCLNYLSDKLDFKEGDELEYTYVARKQDNTNCMIQGTHLSTASGGISPENLQPLFRGDNPNCSQDKITL